MILLSQPMDETVMAKVAEDLTFEVKAKLTIDRATAEACLKMVELYVNRNRINVVSQRLSNGEFKLYYEPAS